MKLGQVFYPIRVTIIKKKVIIKKVTDKWNEYKIIKYITV